MRKIFLLLFSHFLLLFPLYVFGDLEIISREEWGANEEYLYIDSSEWTEIIGNWGEVTDREPTESELKTAEINNILTTTYSEDNEISETIYELNGRKLARPIEQSSKIRGLVIHHTHSEYENSLEGINQIYKYHAISRQWGDIGYNFIIGYDGEIFEGRAGGEMSVGAHDLRNNRQTIGISLIGDYDEKEISKKQYDSLLKLTTYLVKKYDIDLSEKTTFHKNCVGDNCELPIVSEKFYPIIGHRDAGHTDCPGDELYAEIEKIIYIIAKKTLSVSDLYKKNIFDKFDKIGETKLIKSLVSLEKYIDDNKSTKASELKGFLLNYFETNSLKSTSDRTDKYIKIRLSYPDNKEIILTDGEETYKIKRYGDDIRVNNKKEKLFSLNAGKNQYVEINSWNNKPSWDDKDIYNDNKFRGKIVVYPKDNNLIVVNRLKIEDYLKGLGEVSNSENKEKIKSIIIAARTYALWYVNEERKFEGEWYDGSDSPSVFQKYLGYGLEERSPNISKEVDNTKGQVLMYENKLIKPWYFSSSNGKTLSFYEFCINKYNDKICKQEENKYPYLKSVVDYGGIGKTQKGHGVGMPGTGISYFAERGWNAELILKYFYPGIELK